MNMRVMIRTQDGKFTDFLQNPNGHQCIGNMETIRSLPEDLGQGEFYNLTCHQGLSFCLNRCRFERDYHAKITCPSPVVTFAFCMSGRVSTRSCCRNSSMEMSAGDAFAYYFNDTRLEQWIQGGKTVRALAVHFSPETLIRLTSPFNSQNSGAEESLEKALKMGEFYLSRPMTPRMTCLLKDVITCPHKGSFKKLFLESRILELTACHLEQAFLQDRPNGSARPLSREDRSRITHARDILVSHLQFPPSLNALAHDIGMSHARLTRGFKKLYGCTVFEYLRNERLNYGRTLLEGNRLSITEVAFEAGFSSSSHFTAAFQRRYEVSPSDYRLGKRHNTCPCIERLD